jgi:GNAT superfamily N-acetyltransferase
MPSSGVRLARTSDVDDIADINVRSWRSHFAGVLPDDVLGALDVRDLAMSWASSILNPPMPSQRVLVAVDDDRVVGYAAIGPATDPDADSSTAELLALEIDPDQLGQGHGSRLMAAAIDHVHGLGMTDVVSWCALDDQPRRQFLQSAGWGPDSAFRDVEVGVDAAGNDVVVREVRLVTSLD